MATLNDGMEFTQTTMTSTSAFSRATITLSLAVAPQLTEQSQLTGSPVLQGRGRLILVRY